jgi:hypothetical protein
VVVILTTGAGISRKSPESIVSDISGFANGFARDSFSYNPDYSLDERNEEPTGINLHLLVCGTNCQQQTLMNNLAVPFSGLSREMTNTETMLALSWQIGKL